MIGFSRDEVLKNINVSEDLLFEINEFFISKRNLTNSRILDADKETKEVELVYIWQMIKGIDC